jgi:hypothetical protein
VGSRPPLDIGLGEGLEAGLVVSILPAALRKTASTGAAGGRQLHGIFAAEGVDLAFWFTFAGYGLGHDPAPRRDLDLASYGLVKMLPGGPGTGYQGLGWEPKLAFAALANAD